MPRQPSDRVVAYVDKYAPVWQERLGLGHWSIVHVYLDTYEGESGDDFKTTAVCESRWQYLQAKIKWYLPSAVRHDDDELERVLVHELCHVLLAPEQCLVDSRLAHDSSHTAFTDPEVDALAERNYEHLELATEMTARALLRAWAK